MRSGRGDRRRGWCQEMLHRGRRCRNPRRVRLIDLSGRNRCDQRGERRAMPVERRRANVVGRPVRRRIPSRRGMGDEGTKLASIGWAVGPHCRNDESRLGAREATGGELALRRIIAHRIVDQRVSHPVRRNAFIQCVADLVGGVDQARDTFESGNALLREQCQKLIVLVCVGRCRATTQNCTATEQQNGSSRNAGMADLDSESRGTGNHERTSVLQEPVPLRTSDNHLRRRRDRLRIRRIPAHIRDGNIAEGSGADVAARPRSSTRTTLRRVSAAPGSVSVTKRWASPALTPILDILSILPQVNGISRSYCGCRAVD